MTGVNGNSETSGRPIRKFNPGTFQSDEEVTEQFVVRTRELGTVLEILGGNVDSPSCQHVLVLGPRGRGKTMLLARVAAELRTDRRLSESLFPVRFMEESQEVFNVADFWLEALYHLARETAERDPGLSGDLRKTYGDLSTRWAEGSLEARARAAVLEAADRLDRRLVLMVENLQSLSEDVDDDFGWKLRQALQSEHQIMLLASATSRFEGLDDADQPFFELFRNINLQPLDTDECRLLWQVVSGDDVSAREIRPLQILTGGNPRLLVIVAEFARHRSLRLLMEELVTLIDEHTEYFRGHLEVLAKTERRVYLSVIDLWQPSSAGEIATRARMDIRTVSTMLGRLVDRGALIVEGSGRKRQYAAAERIFSIYYKLRRERDEAAIVENLITFMVVFYSGIELFDMADGLASEAAESTVIRTGIVRALMDRPRSEDVISTAKWGIMHHVSEQAFAKAQSVEEKELEETIDAALEAQAFQDVIATVERTVARRSADRAQLSDSFIARILQSKANAHEQLGDFHAVIATCEQIIRRFGDKGTPDLWPHVAEAMMEIGRMRKGLRDLDGAIGMCEAVLEMYGETELPDLQWWVVVSLIYKGQMIREMGDLDGAIKIYRELLYRYGNTELPDLQWWVSAAFIESGSVKKEQGDLDGAIAGYEEVIERYGDSDDSDLRMQVSSAFIESGSVKKEQGDLDGAIAGYTEVIERYGDSDDSDLQWNVATALIESGSVKKEQGDLDRAFAAYSEVVERYGDSDDSDLQWKVAAALIDSAAVKKEQSNLDGAIAAYEEVTLRFGDDDDSDLRMQVATALIESGTAKKEQGDLDSAVAAYEEVIERYGDSDDSDLQWNVATALIDAGGAKKEQGDLDGTIAAYAETVKRFGDTDDSDLQWKVATAIIDLGSVKREQGDLDGAIAVYEEVMAKYGDSDDSDLQRRVAKALMCIGRIKSEFGDLRGAITTCEEVVDRYDDSNTPKLQIWTAMALTSIGAFTRELSDLPRAISVLEQVVQRFGDSEESGFQSWVAIALTEIGSAKRELGDLEGGVEAWEEVVERYGESKASVLQRRVALALIEKGRARKELGDLEGAIAVWDEVVERYGERDAPDVQRWVIVALVNKGMRQAEMNRGVEALYVCEELDRRIRALPRKRETRLEWQVQSVRALAQMVQDKEEAAMEAFRSAYSAFLHDNEVSMQEMLQIVPNLVAAGASERELVDILSSDHVKSAALTPLIVALRERQGETVRAPAEVREVAADVRKQIDDRVRSWPDTAAISPP
ncbi:MAG: tetratricopeptide repeat protein [Gemmatimonadota bacterium]|nr:tetratricopeptide repeat protein [Gemmatimonadota bacterium]